MKCLIVTIIFGLIAIALAGKKNKLITSFFKYVVIKTKVLRNKKKTYKLRQLQFCSCIHSSFIRFKMIIYVAIPECYSGCDIWQISNHFNKFVEFKFMVKHDPKLQFRLTSLYFPFQSNRIA